ncbi:hypothetical protein J6590_099596, partial [Homalodisca vitripennis]
MAGMDEVEMQRNLGRKKSTTLDLVRAYLPNVIAISLSRMSPTSSLYRQIKSNVIVISQTDAQRH